MDKKTAQNLIEDTFNNSFSEEKFIRFSQELLNDIDFSHGRNWSTLIYEDFADKISKYKRVGLYTDPDGNELEVLIVEVEKAQMLERARTSLRNFVIKWLQSDKNKSKSRDYGLAAFYSKEDNGIDWRFSFIKVEQSSFMDEEKGKVKIKKEFTPAKRYSFLVGKYEKAHTAKNQLLPLLQNISNNPTIEEIEAAFSIEKVTDEFFNQYKDLYIKLYEHFENDVNVKSAIDQAGIDNARFTKKLLGQIVFLYFLQKKGWLGVGKNKQWGTGNKRFVQELFERAKKESKNYFKDYLQFLFYQALAKAPKNEDGYYEELKGKFPFLNGGLFEADYEWDKANITIPENLFRNEEKNKAGDVGTGILDVFDRYNFTIKEDEPLDKEVAVDPEMLGKVFENMLDITERKSKGAFYTPREIVHYMCQESLIHYLDNALNSGTISYQAIDSDQLTMFPGSTNKKGNLKIELEHTDNIRVAKKDIETFIREGHFALENDERVATKGKTRTYQYQLPESIRKNADLIDQKLSSIKICDLAIGSGAFPVGLLHELVNAMLVLKPHLSYDYLTEKLKGFGFAQRESISDSRYIYRLKRHIIQESIYGVDIDSSAIDIARLRLWLSLVVDEDDLDPIETLPNLDYKIVVGNSLIGLPDGAMKDLKVEAELEKLKEKFYDITDEQEKKALRQKINTKIREFLDSAEQFVGYKIDFDFKLFFSEVWREKGGFDVVIGNPPYVRVQNLKHTEIDFYKANYDFAWRRIDISILFFELGLKVINIKGLVNYISSNQFISTEYGRSARKILGKKRAIRKMVDFGSLPVFENALTYVSIFQLTSSTNTNCSYVKIEKLPFENPDKFLKIKNDDLTDEPWQLGDLKTLKVLNSISNDKIILGKIAKSWAGIITGNDDLLLFESENMPDYIEYELLKPVLRAQSFDRYSYANPNKYSFYPYEEVNGKTVLIPLDKIKNKYPKAYNFIMENEKSLKSRKDSRKTMGEKSGWYGLIRFGTLSKFNESKIVSPGEVKKNKFAIDLTKSAFSCARVFSINPKSRNVDLYNLLSVLNSSVVEFFMHKNSSLKAGGYFSYSSTILDKVPLPKDFYQLPIQILTRYRLSSIFDSTEILNVYLESILDGVVFELYFPEEIQSAGKEILKHLGDLKPITDNMSEEEKLAIIQSEFERLYDPNHPVRFAIETLDSVEEVRIIKEALK
jgi:hypothetical protein